MPLSAVFQLSATSRQNFSWSNTSCMSCASVALIGSGSGVILPAALALAPPPPPPLANDPGLKPAPPVVGPAHVPCCASSSAPSIPVSASCARCFSASAWIASRNMVSTSAACLTPGTIEMAASPACATSFAHFSTTGHASWKSDVSDDTAFAASAIPCATVSSTGASSTIADCSWTRVICSRSSNLSFTSPALATSDASMT